MIPNRVAFIGLTIAFYLGSFALAKPLPSPLSERLVSHDASERAAALKEFHELPREVQERFIPDLTIAMSDDDPDIRDAASSIVKELRRAPGASPRDLVPSAMNASQAAGRTDRKTAMEQINRDKKAGFPDLEKELQDEKASADDNSQELKPQAENSEAAGLTATLLEGLKDPDPWVRSRSARRIGSLQPVPLQAIPDLTEMLNDKDPETRMAAASALGSIGPEARSAVPALTKCLADPNLGVRTVAGDALKQIQPTIQ